MPRPSKPHVSNGYWRVRINRQTHYLGKADGPAAERQANAEFHRLMAHELADARGDRPLTVNGAIEAWLALNDKPVYPRWLREFQRFAGDVHLSDVDRDLLTRYHVHLKRYTFHRLGRIIDHAKSAHAERDVDPADLWRVLDAIRGNAGRALRFMAAVGARPSEVCGLQWCHVHADAGLCVLPEHKTAERTGEPRVLPLTDDAREALAGMPPTVGPVFRNRHGVAYTSGGLRSILRYAARHVLKHTLTPYQLRHTFAQTASEKDVPVDVLARLLGHTTTRTTAIYYRVRDKRVLAAARTLKLRPGPKSAQAAG
jgi:integrase